MTHICIIHPKICEDSAKALGKAIKADVINPFETDRRDFSEYDLVFNYGCNRNVVAKQLINTKKATARCLDKLITLRLLAKNNVPIPSFTEKKEEVPEWWESIVCRKTSTSSQAKELIYKEKGEELPDSELYTEYFHHKHELRVVVFRGKVVARYLKSEDDQGDWNFIHLEETQFERIDDACAKAAAILGIDYVGFDVLSRSPTRFVIIEANSGAILTPEVKAILKKELMK